MNQNGNPDVNSHTYGHLILIKRPERHTRKKKTSSANDAGLTGYLSIDEWTRSVFITLHKTQVQVSQRPQRKIRYIEPGRRENGE